METLYQFSIIDYLVFGFLLLVSALIGVWFGFFAKQKQDSTAEYLMGGKTMGIFPISMSLISSSISGISLLAIPAEIYVYGSQFFLVIIAQTFANYVMASAFIPVFHKLQIMSSYEYLNLRFNKSVRTMGSILFVLKMFLYIPVVIYVPALAFNQVTGINIHLITPVVCIVCVFYTTMGGLKAVVWTDTLQTVLMYGGVFTVIVLGTIRVGGIAEVFERNRRADRLELFNFDMDPTVRYTFWSVVVGDVFNQLSHCAVNQAIVQRCLAMPTMRKANLTILIFTIGLVCIVSMCCYTGVLIFALFHDCDPVTTKTIGKADQLLPYFVVMTSGSVPGLAGLFVAGIFSAALSSMSTGLNSMAGVISEDMIRPLLKRPITEKQASTIMKVLAAVIGVLCTASVVVVEKMGALLQLEFSLSAITSSALLCIFVLGLFFPWANSKGALAGCVSSVFIISWLSAGSQLSAVGGKKPISLEGCDVSLVNDTIFSQPTTAATLDESSFAFYSVSFMYYALIGSVTGILVGLVASFLTGPQDPAKVNPDLLAPVIHRFLPSRPNVTNTVLQEMQPLKQQHIPALNGCDDTHKENGRS